MINPIRKISDQEKSDNYIQKFLQSINIDLIDTVSRCLKLNYIYFLLTSEDLNFRIDRPQRMIIVEILNWLYAARDKTWSNFKLFQYLHWVKETLDTRLCQIWAGLHTDWRLYIVGCKHSRSFVNKHYSHVQGIILYHRWVVVNFYRKKETALRLSFKSCVFSSEPHTFFAKI